MIDRLIVITSPEYFEGEAEVLNRLFELGLTRLHIRKPDSTVEQIKKLLGKISSGWRQLITIHYYQELAEEMKLGGKHYSYPQILSEDAIGKNKRISCSVHSWEEVKNVEGKVEYSLIGPVFNSISKRGYESNQALSAVPDNLKKQKMIALGGINAENYKCLLEKGFYGVAVLGYLWEKPMDCIERFEMLKEKILNCSDSSK